MHSSCAAWQMLFPLHQNTHYAGEQNVMAASWIPAPGLCFSWFPKLFWVVTRVLGKNKPPCRGGRKMGSDLAFTSVPFFLASETQCVDSKGAGMLEEDDWSWISQLEWHWLGHSHQVHRGDASRMWKASGPVSFLALPLKGGISNSAAMSVLIPDTYKE